MADDKKPVMHFGYEITDTCPCGEKVRPYERQELVFNPNQEKWNRMCASCCNKNRTFSSSLAGVV